MIDIDEEYKEFGVMSDLFRVSPVVPFVYDKLANHISKEARSKPLLAYDVHWKKFNQEHRGDIARAYLDVPADQLRLPWPAMWVEDRDSLMYLSISSNDETLLHPGLRFESEEYIPLSDGRLAKYLVEAVCTEGGVHRDLRRKLLVGLGKRTMMSWRCNGSIGDCTWSDGLPSIQFDMSAANGIRSLIVDGAAVILADDTETTELLGMAVVGSVQSCFEQALLAASPFGWLVDRVPKPPPTTKRERTEAEHHPSKYRTIHILLSNKQRRVVFPSSHSEPTGDKRRSPAPHPRRGHWRYVKTQEKPVWIRPQWIGPQEVEWDGCRYRVRLDL